MNLASSWSPFWSIRPLSQIVYVGNDAASSYLQRLKDIGSRLNIPVHLCVGQGGIHSPKFKTNWERRVARGRDDISPPGDGKLERDDATRNRQIFHDDDENDEERDEEAVPLKRRKGDMPHDACARFISRMVRQHCTKSDATSAARSYARNIIGNRDEKAAMHAEKRQNRSATAGRLPHGPKLGTMRKTRSFLTLRDKPLQNLGFLAHAPQRTATNGPITAVGSGAVTTRSQTRRNEGENADSTAVGAAAELPQPGATSRKRRSRRKNVNNNNNNNNNHNNNNNNNYKKSIDDGETPLSEESKRTLDSTLRAKEAEEIISFPPETLILLDDALCPVDPLRATQGLNAAREEREIYMATLNWICKVCLEQAHHFKVDFRLYFVF